MKARAFEADYTTGVTVDGWDVDGGGQAETQPFHAAGTGTKNFTLRNSKIHDAMNPNAMVVLGGRGILVDHVDIYDDLNNTDGAIHDECLRLQDASNVTLTRSHFWSCNVMDVFVTDSDLATNYSVENNVFEAPTGSRGNAANAFTFRCCGSPSPRPDNVAFRYNTFGSSGISMDSTQNAPTARGMVVAGNYFATNPPCGFPNTAYAYNVTPTHVPNCGGIGAKSFSLSSITAGFVNYHPFTGNEGASPEPPGDYHLRARSPLKNRGNPAAYPRRDLNGNARPVGKGPDIGAYEYQGR